MMDNKKTENKVLEKRGEKTQKSGRKQDDPQQSIFAWPLKDSGHRSFLPLA